MLLVISDNLFPSQSCRTGVEKIKGEDQEVTQAGVINLWLHLQTKTNFYSLFVLVCICRPRRSSKGKGRPCHRKKRKGSVAAAQKRFSRDCRDWIKQTIVFVSIVFNSIVITVSIVSRSIVLI